MGENKELHVALVLDERLAKTEYVTAVSDDGKWIFYGHRELYRFLILEDGTFVIGPVSNHGTLWLLYSGQEKLLVRPQLSGAGIVDKSGNVSSWSSTIFGAETPEELQGPIKDLIKGLIGGGSLPLPPKE